MSSAAGISERGRHELAQLFGAGRRFITPSDVAKDLGTDAESAARKLARWAEEGWVRRVRRGLYIAVPVDAPNPSAWSEDPLIVAEQVWSPCFFTGWTSARHWDLTEQVFRTTVVKTGQRVRASTVTMLDHDYLVSHVDPDDDDWGLRTAWHDGVRLRFADPARTVLEILDRPRLGGGIRHCGEVLTAYLDDEDPAALVEAGERQGNGAAFKRLGYLVESLELDQPLLLSACRARVSAGISALDPDGPEGGRRAMRWGLRINVRIVPEDPS